MDQLSITKTIPEKCLSHSFRDCFLCFTHVTDTRYEMIMVLAFHLLMCLNPETLFPES